LALGASVMLGGATGARAGDLAGLFNATQSAASFPPWAQFFQRIPQNWCELPVRFNLSEAVEYNSNAPAVAADAVVWQAAKPIGAFEPKPTMTLQTWSS
jgi:hypothetical protein